jgi:hypothetical protein
VLLLLLAGTLFAPATQAYEALNLTSTGTQCGVILASPNLQINVTLSTTLQNTSRAILFSSDSHNNAERLTARLLDTENMTFQRGVKAGSNTISGAWCVAEFGSGLRVQRGNITLPDGTISQDVSIDPVNVSKSLPIVYWNMNGTNGFRFKYVIGFFSNLSGDTSNILVISRGDNTSDTQAVDYQVIEFLDNTTVQHSYINMTGSTYQANFSAVNTSRAFVYASYNVSRISSTDNRAVMLNFTLINSTMVEIRRTSTTTSNNIYVSLVEFGAEADVLVTQNSSVVTSSLENVSLPVTPMNLSRTVTIGSYATSSGGGTTERYDTYYFNMTSESELRATRIGAGASSGNNYVTIFGIQFPFVREAPAAGTTYRVSAGDVLASSDVQARMVSGTRLAEEAMSALDVDGRGFSGSRPASDALVFADAGISLPAYVRAGSDVLVLVDESRRTAELRRSLVDAFLFLDAASKVFSASRMAGSAVAFDDSAGRTFTGFRASDDAMILGDSAGRVVTLMRMGADVFVFVDADQRRLTALRVSPDEIRFTDATGRSLTVSRLAPDLFLVSDETGAFTQKIRVLTEALSFSDAAVRRADFIRAVEESVILRELGRRTATLGRTLADLLVLLDFSASANVTAGGGEPSPVRGGGFVLPATKPPPIIITARSLARVRLSPEMVTYVFLAVLLVAAVLWRERSRRKSAEDALEDLGIDVGR